MGSFLSWNCGGLRTAAKLREVLDFVLGSFSSDFVFLQETHLRVGDEAAFEEALAALLPSAFVLWGFSASSRWGGTAIIVCGRRRGMPGRQEAALLQTRARSHPDGWWVALDVDILGARLTIASVYAPTSGRDDERLELFGLGFETLRGASVDRLLMLAGDWNCVLDGRTDRLPPTVGADAGGAELGFRMADWSLVDLWLERGRGILSD